MPDNFDPYRQIAILACDLWSMSLNGKGVGNHVYRFMGAEPVPGDLVLEKSTVYFRLRQGDFDSGGLGFFVRKTMEPVAFAEEWMAKNPGEPVPMEDAWYIRALATGDELRWTNCSFIRIPSEMLR